MAVLPVLSLLCAVFVLSLTTEVLTDADAGGAEVEISESPELKVKEKRAACQSGWSASGSRCFKLFSQKTTWSEAEGECVKNGGHLASIHNIVEAQFVGKLSGGSAATWIGGGGDAESFRWYWTDGSAFDYSNWRAWEPNNRRGNEHCIQTNFRESGVWNDFTCHEPLPFVCAK